MTKYQTHGKCTTCDYRGTIDLHHMKTRGSGGDDYDLMQLCRKCHTEYHTIGRSEFVKKYRLEQWMRDHNWEYCDFMHKWIKLSKDGWEVD